MGVLGWKLLSVENDLILNPEDSKLVDRFAANADSKMRFMMHKASLHVSSVIALEPQLSIQFVINVTVHGSRPVCVQPCMKLEGL